MLLPLLRILFSMIKFEIRNWNDNRLGKENGDKTHIATIRIDSEYIMRVSKLEIIFAFSIISPILIILIIFALNVNFYVYSFFIALFQRRKKQQLVFTIKFDYNLKLRFKYLWIGIICQQFFSFVFLYYSTQFEASNELNLVLSFVFLAIVVVLDIKFLVFP